MSAGGGGGGKKKKRGGEGFHPDERWLLTYADMITLLMALFIILWAMSTTSADKFDALKLSLTNAFGSPLFVGQNSILEGGPGSDSKVQPVTPADAVIPDQQKNAGKTEAEKAATAAELREVWGVREAIGGLRPGLGCGDPDYQTISPTMVSRFVRDIAAAGLVCDGWRVVGAGREGHGKAALFRLETA